jgi:hypothetical protein
VSFLDALAEAASAGTLGDTFAALWARLEQQRERIDRLESRAVELRPVQASSMLRFDLSSPEEGDRAAIIGRAVEEACRKVDLSSLSSDAWYRLKLELEPIVP